MNFLFAMSSLLCCRGGAKGSISAHHQDKEKHLLPRAQHTHYAVRCGVEYSLNSGDSHFENQILGQSEWNDLMGERKKGGMSTNKALHWFRNNGWSKTYEIIEFRGFPPADYRTNRGSGCELYEQLPTSGQTNSIPLPKRQSKST